MHEPRFFAATLSAIALPLLVLPVLMASSEPSRAATGTTWSRGFLGGETLRLLDSGAFERSDWSDMGRYPAPEPERGHWRRDGRMLVLELPDGTTDRYERALSEGCVILVPQQGPMAGDPNRYSVFIRRGDRCLEVVAEARTRSQ